MTTLTADTALTERGIGVGVYCTLAQPCLAGMAEEAGRLDGTAPARDGVSRISRRDVPRTGLGIPRDGGLEQEAIAEVAEAPAGRSRSDVVVELAMVEPGAFGEPDQAFGIDIVADLGRCVAERSRSQGGKIAAATHGHGRGTVALQDFLVTSSASLVPNKESGDGEEQQHIRGAGGCLPWPAFTLRFRQSIDKQTRALQHARISAGEILDI